MNPKDEKPAGGLSALLSALFRSFVALNVGRLRLYAMEKVAALLSVLIIAFLLASVGLMCFFYATQCLVVLSVEALGSVAMSHALAMLICLVAGMVVYRCRQSLVVKPFMRLLTKLWSEE